MSKRARSSSRVRLADFSEILTPRGLRTLDGHGAGRQQSLRQAGERYIAMKGVIRRDVSVAIPPLLDRHLAKWMRPVDAPIPPESITGMTRDYSEALPKAMRLQSAMLNGRSRAAEAARAIGVIALLRSQSLLRFAEQVSGFTLNPDVGCQVLCYRPGDYVGPHNDHHPESPTTRDGFVDVQLTFTNEGVKQQWLVHERDGHLTEMVDIAQPGLISTYFLPFWHYTTPLVALRGHETTARRWLLLATYELESPSAAKVHNGVPLSA